MLNKSPLFAVSSKSTTSSSNPIDFIGVKWGVKVGVKMGVKVDDTLILDSSVLADALGIAVELPACSVDDVLQTVVRLLVDVLNVAR